LNPFSLINKNIIITGASSGLGRNCAIECSKQGANLFLIGRNMDALVQTLNDCLNQENHLLICCDLLDTEKLKEIFLPLNEKFQFHGLVNFAGISLTLPFRNTTETKLNELFQANIYSAVNMSKIAIKGQKENGSNTFSLIFIGSIMGVVGESGKFVYAMTKGALLAGVKSLAIELAPKQIRVNMISPGWVQTPMTENQHYANNQEAMDELNKNHPLGVGKPEDISWACIYLLSDAARWITGTNLLLDGGYTAK
jgi:NAD(P)-dependent dehydrogenase (short-subunit alcohol dehydrogenase family)